MVAPLLAIGCGTDCRLLCERREEANCEGDADAPDCEYQCKHEEDLVTNAGCESEYDDVLTCIDELDDICDMFPPVCDPGAHCKDPECDNEIKDLNDCYSDYCTDHPHNNECETGLAPNPT
jgi:hypothetical protein